LQAAFGSLYVAFEADMETVLYKMVGFENDTKFRAQDKWQDVVYAGEDGSILVLLRQKFTPQHAEPCSAQDWCQLKQTKDASNGRWHVLIRRTDQKPRKIYVHHLVLWAWRGPHIDEKRGALGVIHLQPHLGRHLYDNCADNSAAHLAWGTAQDNRADPEANRAGRQRFANSLNGVRITLECTHSNWEIVELSRHGEKIDLPSASKIVSKRQTDPVRLLKSAIGEIRGDTAIRTAEKRPLRYCGHRPCSDYDVWMPADGSFEEAPNDNAELRKRGEQNQSVDFTINDIQGKAYKYIVKS
jgi:hypothetical protein